MAQLSLEGAAMDLLEQQIQFLKHVHFSTPENKRKVATVETPMPEIVVEQAGNSDGRPTMTTFFPKRTILSCRRAAQHRQQRATCACDGAGATRCRTGSFVMV